jgi:hypothetical protein
MAKTAVRSSVPVPMGNERPGEVRSVADFRQLAAAERFGE